MNQNQTESKQTAPEQPTDEGLDEPTCSPLGCDFHAPYFGASYPDACCIEGYLWDLDSCDVPGGSLSSGGDVPCPQCNREAWLEDHREEMEMEGYEAAEKGEPREYRHHLLRMEQPGDEAKVREWWLVGYDLFLSENAIGEPAAGSPTP